MSGAPGKISPRASAVNCPIPTVCTTVLLISMTVSLPVPLYGEYAIRGAVGNGVFGAALACYGLSILPALFLFGGISDRIGRRLALEVALGFGFLAITTISAFPTISALAVSRFAQGIAMGLVGASATAFLAETLAGETAPVRAANYVSAMLALGYGLGGLTTALCLSGGFTRMPLSYAAHMVACLLTFPALIRLPLVAPRHVAPLLSLPFFPAGALPFCVAIGAAWSLMSVVLSLLPIELGRHGLTLWSGLAAFLMPMAGLGCQQFSRHLRPAQAIRIGLVLVPAGALLLALGIITRRLELVLAGAAAAGAAGVGFSLQGGLAAVSVLGGAEKARAAAGFFLACYLGLCSAPIVVGWTSDRTGTNTAMLLLTVVLTIASGGTEVGFRIAAAGTSGLASLSRRVVGGRRI